MKKLITTLAAVCVAVSAWAVDFVDTSHPSDIVKVGLRFGLTSSSASTDQDYDILWKRGFSTGAVVDLNVRNFFSIRPGLFFENRSYDYRQVQYSDAESSVAARIGHTRRNALNVPVLASFHFNISKAVKWNVEVGPYFTFGVGNGKDKVTYVVSQGTVPSWASSTNYSHLEGKRNYYGSESNQMKKFDAGLQFGTGVEVLGHYVFNISYQRGLANVAHSGSLKNKGWTFSVGYNF